MELETRPVNLQQLCPGLYLADTVPQDDDDFMTSGEFLDMKDFQRAANTLEQGPGTRTFTHIAYHLAQGYPFPDDYYRNLVHFLRECALNRTDYLLRDTIGYCVLISTQAVYDLYINRTMIPGLGDSARTIMERALFSGSFMEDMPEAIGAFAAGSALGESID